MQKTFAVKTAVIAAVVAVAVVALVARNARKVEDEQVAEQEAAAPAGGAQSLPGLIDLGSKTCIPCKMMKPVLEELRRDYEGRLLVEFIDVNADPDRAKPYGISLIPTQIWYDASGKELTRHEGFISKEDILAVFVKHGLDLGTEMAPAQRREANDGEDTEADPHPG